MLNSPEPSPPTKSLYTERINRAIDHIQRHLDRPLTLEGVAQVACFSPFHFHRIFRFHTGEPLNAFVKRVRLERAIALMSQRGWATRRQNSLTDIAVACGFGSAADFSRSFKQHFGVPPSLFDVTGFRAQQRDRWQDQVAGPEHRHLLDGLPPGENPDHFSVRLRPLPARTVAYLRIANSYTEGEVPRAADRLVAWAERLGLVGGQWLGYTWDDPEIVAPENCRYDVGLEVPPATPLPDGEISRCRFEATQVAEIEIRGGIDLEMRALDWLYGTWLPGSGFVPTDQPCFEAWIGRPFAHGFDHFELVLQLPVERG